MGFRGVYDEVLLAGYLSMYNLFKLTLVITHFSGDADDAELLGSNTRIVTKEAELVADFDDENRVEVLALDFEKLDLHWRELSRFRTLLFGLGRWGLILVSFGVAILVIFRYIVFCEP